MFKLFKLRYIWLIVVFLYSFLWLLDAGKAKEIVGNLAVIGRQVASKIPILKSKIKPPAATPDSSTPGASEPVKISLSASAKQTLQNFLNSPNEELINKKSSYTQKAGYYIDVDIDKGTCKAKYTKEYRGTWKTPAEILCPQVNKILQIPTKGNVPVSSPCLLTVEAAKKQGWDCKKVP